jgi:RimJ/RimL family protein N-acetyltransferase
VRGVGHRERALPSFLDLETTRPLYAGAAADNTGSLRVLEKCGFRVTVAASQARVMDAGGTP